MSQFPDQNHLGWSCCTDSKLINNLKLCRRYLLYTSLQAKFSTLSGEGVRGSPTMKELKMNSCTIDDDGIAILSGSLLLASNLKGLELQKNLFGPTGAQALARMIEGSNSIESIALLGCDAIGNEGAITLLRSLTVNQSVQTLFLPDIYEYAVGSEYYQQANRVVWLPDIALQSAVDLSGAHISAKSLGKFSQCMSAKGKAAVIARENNYIPLVPGTRACAHSKVLFGKI